MPKASDTEELRPKFENQAHYDLSDDFGLFQDPTCKVQLRNVHRPDVTLEEAQLANVDLNLEQLDLRPGTLCSRLVAAGV